MRRLVPALVAGAVVAACGDGAAPATTTTTTAPEATTTTAPVTTTTEPARTVCGIEDPEWALTFDGQAEVLGLLHLGDGATETFELAHVAGLLVDLVEIDTGFVTDDGSPETGWVAEVCLGDDPEVVGSLFLGSSSAGIGVVVVPGDLLPYDPAADEEVTVGQVAVFVEQLASHLVIGRHYAFELWLEPLIPVGEGLERMLEYNTALLAAIRGEGDPPVEGRGFLQNVYSIRDGLEFRDLLGG